ncbi:STAS domain-containing protein [Streptosporangium sp. DT93]|uniref:STAS domain-containing protein n=1 Tax=Streptosporangium sp. DT93 TaxID=3393428 RepID=UPI003CF86BD8
MQELHLKTAAAELSATAEEGTGVVVISGSLDFSIHELVVEFMDRAFARFGPDLILDLDRLDLLDSRATGLIVLCWKRSLEEGGELSLVATERGATRILWITGLTMRIPAFPTLREALDARRPEAGSAGQ